MSKSDSHAVRNGLIVTIVGGIGLSFLPAVRSFVISATKWLWSFITGLWGILAESYSLPGWLLLMLSALSMYVILLILRKLWPREQPGYRQYVQDTIYGAVWRWVWSGDKINSLWCYCPVCDCELIYDDSACRSVYGENHTDFLCERCGDRGIASIPGGDRLYATSAIEREIRRRIRTEEYKKVLTNKD